ncbi:SDR family oxidoreductase [Streptomyces sp. NBC_01497]|uniref:SDR family oxidoreductase n=1 Tax=Streptomyces sp. NBC_01497 TaxID=2903885 RepID=UPI002E3343BE|nr:SDR family oxidoreductase [Streptomyces sp. NBC_01497]
MKRLTIKRSAPPPRRNVLITGASSGLGAELARRHAAQGRNLALCARRTDRLHALREELPAQHPTIRVETRRLDVTDHQQVFAVFDELTAALGGLDRVIVNAGVSRVACIGTGDFALNQQILATNLNAALTQCEAALRIMRAQRSGHLVMVSSVGALRGLPGLTAYSASKAGAATLAEGIRAGLFDTPIAVTTLLPGFIESEMTDADKRPPLIVSTRKGVDAMMKAINAERATAIIPPWPWRPLAVVLRHIPVRLLARLG